MTPTSFEAHSAATITISYSAHSFAVALLPHALIGTIGRVCVDSAALSEAAIGQGHFVVALSHDGELAPSSADRSEDLNRATCHQLINDLVGIAVSTKWGDLGQRLNVLLDASYDPDERTAPLQPASISTLMELVRQAPNLPRPSIGLTSAGFLWLEWAGADRERAAIECLPEARIRVSWVKHDRRFTQSRIAARHGTMSIDEFVSEDLRRASIWKRLASR